VTLNAALGPLDYRVPDGMAVEPGSIVVAPLGPRQLIGVVWEPERLQTEEVGDNRLRPLVAVMDVPPIPAAVRRLVEWTSDYYLAPAASVLRMVLPSSAALEGPRQLTEYAPTGRAPDRLTPQREKALAAIEGRQGTIRELADHAKVSDSVMRGLANSGALEPVQVTADKPLACPDPDFAPPELSEEQAAAAKSLADAIGNGFDPVLLDGVTGSGKTEVYFEAIAECLRQGKQALVLLPEIALTEPFLKRFEARFGCEPVAWHSDLRSSQRRRAWRGIASGEAKVTVGARSALFLPYPALDHVPALDRRSRGREDHRNVLELGAHDRRVSRVILDSFLLLEGGLVGLVDDNEAEVRVGEEEGRARADCDRRFAARDAAPGAPALG
jgi:primosomal protein N' (replication factor Y)